MRQIESKAKKRKNPNIGGRARPKMIFLFSAENEKRPKMESEFHQKTKNKTKTIHHFRPKTKNEK